MSEEYEDPTGRKERYEGDGPNLRYDDFVGRIVEDPNEPPGVTLLSGYLGYSSEEGHVRLYLDEELCRYVEIPEKVIRHTQELAPEQSPLGGSLVWIDRDAEVLHGKAGSERRKATFLEGQIAQDYIGGAGSYGTSGGGTTTQTRECLIGGGGIVATDMGPGCGQSNCGPCIPPTEQVYCRTLTGILCTRFGPSCRSVYVKQCPTFDLRQCQSLYIACQQSVHFPCITQNEPRCVASGFVGCNPPIDVTIWEEQFGQQAAFAGGGAGGGAAAQGFAAIPPPSSPIICPDTRFFVACNTLTAPECGVRTTAVNCPTQVGCFTRNNSPVCQRVSQVAVCGETRNIGCVVGTAFGCPTRNNDLRCRASAVAFCPDTRAGCQFQSAACGIDDPLGGVGAQGFEAQAFVAGESQFRDCRTQTSGCHAVTVTPACHGGGGGGGGAALGGAVAQQTFYCQAQYTSRLSPCPSHLFRCPSQLVACPSLSNYKCPTLGGCGYTRFGACETFGQCPSAVDACPSRFGCYNTQVCGGGESIACFPGGGGGGFDPGGFGGGGFGGGF